jgi:hypothetical protein
MQLGEHEAETQVSKLACERTPDDLNEPVALSYLASPLPNYGRSSREPRV